MALRAEIVIIDDDENIPNVVKVPMYKCPEGELGIFAENMVIDPDTGDVYRFTFQAEVVGQIAPKREGSTFPKEGDVVRIIGNDHPTHHNLKIGELAEVLEVDSYGDIRAEGVGLLGKTIGQYVSRDDYILE